MKSPAKLKAVESEPRVGLYDDTVIKDAVQDLNNAGVLRAGQDLAQDTLLPADAFRHGMCVR